MPNDGRIYDGHLNLFGVDGNTDPSSLGPQFAAKSVNRVFRGGRNKTRPPFRHYAFSCENDEDEDIIKHGNFQGWMPYVKRREGRENGAVVAIAGKIFFLTFVNETICAKRIWSDNDPKLLHTWMVQAEEYVYIQNGKDKPVMWDGSFPLTSRRLSAESGEMPIGTIMAYAYGRVWLSNAYNQILAGDIIYGNGLTKSDNTKNFKETTYWAEGGYFSQPAGLGKITGMIVVPRQGVNLTGQGELLIISENGASAIDPSIPRLSWKDAKIQAVVLAGRGSVAFGSVIAVNNDCWFRSNDGIASYHDSIANQTRQSTFSKLSREVNQWLDGDTPWLLESAKMLYFNNRVFCTTYPEMETPVNSEYGAHIFHNGMVVLDIDPASGVQGDTAFNWDGLWTGIRVCGLLNAGSRAFAFSHDIDGENRIYGIDESGQDDFVNEENVKINSFYVTKRFSWDVTQKTNRFEVKRLVGGELWVSGLTERCNVSAHYRPDFSNVWQEFMPSLAIGSEFNDEYKFTSPLYKKIKFPTPKTSCGSGFEYPENKGAQFQFAITMEGSVTVESLRVAVAFPNEANSAIGVCGDSDAGIAINGTIENDFAYNILNNGQHIKPATD